MKAIKLIYKIGPGPSSSHTLAIKNVCEQFLNTYNNIDSITVSLYGSLSLTGKGHFTDKIIYKTFKNIKCNILFKLDWEYEYSNGLIIEAIINNEVVKWVIFSLGGGDYKILNHQDDKFKIVYPHSNFDQIKDYIKTNNISIIQYINKFEPDLFDYLDIIFKQMINTIDNGLNQEGLLLGDLNIKRIAKQLNKKGINNKDNKIKLMSYAYSANEENACCNICVTAPTLGASGVVSSIIYHLYKDLNYSKDILIQGLAISGLFANIVKENATISGASGGCMAEVGVACSMGSALLAYVNGLTLNQIEYAAEMGIEHHLGLTCDPIKGYVIIPCIERNALASLRSFDNYLLSKYSYDIKANLVSFDVVVKTMNYTANKLVKELKETSLGGLAKEFYC